MSADDDVRERVEAFADRNPDAGVMDVLARAGGGIEPTPENRSLAAAAVGGDQADAGGVEDTENAESADFDDTEARRTDSRDANPTLDTPEPGSSDDGITTDGGVWSEADFTAPESGVWPPALHGREQWMGHVEKKPFAPWADRDHPEADDDDDARWKWGLRENYVDGETVAIAEDDPRLDGRVFLQREDDPFAYVDGDDVRDPETGEVHPAFVAVLNHLGLTYADVSQSGAGVHAVYRGELPEGVKQAAWRLDDEPFGGNDDLPSVEIYARKRVCVMTGEHVPGTPTEVREWSDSLLWMVLELNDQLSPVVTGPETARETVDLSDHDPEATTSGETTDDIRDVFVALDRLDPKRVAEKTIVHRWNDDASTSEGTRAFSPTWGRNSNGTANIVDNQIWQDTGDEAGYGGPVVMALIDAGEMRPRNADPSRANGSLWWKGVEHLRDLGFEIPEVDDAGSHADAERVAVLPNSPRAKAAANGWAWRNADRGGEDDALTVDDARERTTETIADAYDRGGRVLVEALPTLGKSYGAVAAAAETDEPITVLTGRGREEQYEQFKEWCANRGLKAKVLSSVKRDCETFDGEHGEDIATTVNEWYDRGATGKEIHRDAEYELGKPLPCDGPAGARCSYKAAWQFEADDYDVLIGHYNHAHVDSVTSGRTVVFDESPGDAFETTLGGSRLAGAVTRYIQNVEALPFDDYTDLLANRDDPERRARALAHFEDNDPDRDAAQAFATGGHALAPLAAYTILAGAGDGDAGRNLGNGWERAKLPGMGDVGLFDRENGNVHLLTPPDLKYARGVVGLDGTPTPRMWELALGGRMDHRRVLDTDVRREYVRDGLGLNIIRTTDAVKPYSGTTEHVAVDQDHTLLEAVADEHDTRPALLTTATAERAYENADEPVLDAVQDYKHYGNLKGSNQHAQVRLGAVIGSRHYGDGFIQKWGAFAGEGVERGEGKGESLEYSGVGEDIHRHMTEHETLQALMRFGRDGHGATVYVHTNTLPEWIPVTGGPPESGNCVIRTRSDGERAVIEAAKDLAADGEREGWSTTDVAEHPDVEVTERQARTHLARLVEDGYLSARPHPDDGRKKEWTDEDITELVEHGEAELTASATESRERGVSETKEVAEGPRTVLYTWDFRNRGVSENDDAGASTEAPSATREVRADGGDPPPG
jgi:hypothetical protein